MAQRSTFDKVVKNLTNVNLLALTIGNNVTLHLIISMLQEYSH